MTLTVIETPVDGLLHAIEKQEMRLQPTIAELVSVLLSQTAVRKYDVMTV